jgi:hypothetical protein
MLKDGQIEKYGSFKDARYKRKWYMFASSSRMFI